MKADGFGNVHLQAVKVPHWVRGSESARIMKPIQKPLNMLGLGGSVATPKDGITATVVVVTDFDELERLGAEKVKGKIVLYDAPWQGYGRTVVLPQHGRLARGQARRGGRRSCAR